MADVGPTLPGFEKDTSSRPSLRRRKPQLGILRPALARSGRAAAGIESAAKKKANYRSRVEGALARLERADPSRRPELGEVARLAQVSTATVRRHCKEHPEFGHRIAFRRLAAAPSPAEKGAVVKVEQMQRVILSLSAKIEELEGENRALREAQSQTEKRYRDDSGQW